MKPFNTTLIQHIHKTTSDNKLVLILQAIEEASKIIALKIRMAGILNIYGSSGNINSQDEDVKKLDVIANETFITCLKNTNVVSLIISEENKDIIEITDSSDDYICIVDPLDGSSNIDANIPTGSIFGIYKRDGINILTPGNNLIVAGYTLYSSATMMILGFSDINPNGFTLYPETNEFILTHPNITIPANNNIYSINEGNLNQSNSKIKRYISDLKQSEKPYSLRYVGSMVADLHRTLIYGGIFLYPENIKTNSGKLRLLYEVNPMALLIEGAGGKAINDNGQRILDIMPLHHHQRIGIILGSKSEIQKFESY